MKDKIIEKQDELIKSYQIFTRWVLRHTPEIISEETRYRIRDLQDDIAKIEQQLASLPKEQEMSDEDMNQKAIEYGKLKQERRSGMLTDYDVSEAEIDFLRGYNAWYRDHASQHKGKKK